MSVDKILVKFKGRLFFKQYLPKPGGKFGIKIWAICDSKNGYLLDFSVYSGKEKDADKNVALSTRVVENLSEKYTNEGHIIYMDNFYSSVELYEKLLKKILGLVVL